MSEGTSTPTWQQAKDECLTNFSDQNNNNNNKIPCLVIGDQSIEKENFCALVKLHSQDLCIHGTELQIFNISDANSLDQFFQSLKHSNREFLVIILCYRTEEEKKHMLDKWLKLVLQNKEQICKGCCLTIHCMKLLPRLLSNELATKEYETTNEKIDNEICKQMGTVSFRTCDTDSEDMCMEAMHDLCESVSNKHWLVLKGRLSNMDNATSIEHCQFR
jgi:hypothetical protein